jgi:hypothetical protein
MDNAKCPVLLIEFACNSVVRFNKRVSGSGFQHSRCITFSVVLGRALFLSKATSILFEIPEHLLPCTYMI